MKIVVIGAGAMGSIYGGRLSQKNEVYLIDTNREIVDEINRHGLRLLEQEKELVFHPKARTSAAGIGEAELVILFVKALYSRPALAAAGEVIGENTYVMTLQNGAGHERIMERIVPRSRIVIGKTEQNSTLVDGCTVLQGNPEGMTVLSPGGEELVDAFAASSLPCAVSEDIPRW